MDFYPFILTMIFAHFVGDYVCQSGWMSVEKKNSWCVMVAHCVLYTGCIMAALIKYRAGFGIPDWIPIGIFLSHGMIDYFKCYLLNAQWRKEFQNFVHPSDMRISTFVDQLLHFIVLLILILKYR